MNTPTRRLLLCAILAGAAATLAGCCCTRKGGMTDTDKYPYEDGKCDHQVRITVDPRDGPSGNSGSLTIPVTSFASGNNGQSCFPTGSGWDRFYVTFYFLAPNVSPLPNPNNYPNIDNLNSLTISTTDTANGNSLDTGIVIFENLNPNNKVCNDTASPQFTFNPKLSKATFAPTTNGKKYRVTVFYKSGTLGGVNNVKVNWSYP